MSIAQRVADAFAATPRTGHLPAAQRPHAHLDVPLPLLHGLTNSQPSTVARMLELLDPPVGAAVLDVGAGSGWTTALLAHLVGPEGSVAGVELDPELADWGAERLAATGRPWATIEPADPAVLGLPSRAPFDRILVSAMAAALPRALVDQVADGGVIVAPVAGRMCRAVRAGADVEVSWHGWYRFVPLIEPA